jgi:gamma-glutamyl AIG2-like cyclotransferase
MAYFFFGTLMDRDVLATVLDRPVTDDELERAWLHGYRRVRAANTSYPVLLPAPGLVVSGVVFLPGSTLDELRIRHFEEGEYAENWSLVRLPGGRQLAARVFLALEALQATDEAWDLGTWASAHKADFLAQCCEWMRDCPAYDGELAGRGRSERAPR